MLRSACDVCSEPCFNTSKIYMTRLLITIMLATWCVSSFGQNADGLYVIEENGLYGYIDKTGNTIIKPRFASAGSFSEGVAPVREHGTYGYIDTKGNYVVAPTFDLALPFNYGLAKVFVDGKPSFIDKKGNNTFSHNYKRISDFNNRSFAIVVTTTDKYGVIDKSGRLMIDTVFARINDYKNGIAVVTGLNHNPYPDDRSKTAVYEKGVIDTLGNWIVNYGKYKVINDFINGYTKVELPVASQEDQHNNYGVIDSSGKYMFTVPSQTWTFDNSVCRYSQDIAVVSINSFDSETKKARSSGNRSTYRGVVNTRGEVVLYNVGWNELTAFSCNRAFAKTSDSEWILIDREGNTLGTQQYDDILFDRYNREDDRIFQNGKAFVKTETGWGVIDTTGKYVIEPFALNNVRRSEMRRQGSIIIVEEYVSDRERGDFLRYGFWNTLHNVVLEPQFQDIDMQGFNSDLVAVTQNGKSGYINTKGELIWSERDEAVERLLNVDYMNRGYFYASSKFIKELAGLGGWGSSDNESKRMNSLDKFSPNSLQILIDTNQRTLWGGRYKAVKLFVVNTSPDTLYFDAQDSRLDMKIQAQDKNGEWRDIEYLPSSCCGNSYHTLFLSPMELWEFSTPVYQGGVRTKIRAKLLYRRTKNNKEIDVIYSNEVNGLVNPGQFWNKREYFPLGIMDPYED